MSKITVPIQIRVSPDDYKAISEAAREQRLPLATFIKWLVMREVQK